MLLTKLHIPPASQNIVHRPELCEKLNMGLSQKLIFISSPAGNITKKQIINFVIPDQRS